MSGGLINDRADLARLIAASGGGPHYVYLLRVPNGEPSFGGSGTPFYVGIGQGSRLFAHEEEARDPARSGAKVEMIRSIWANGGEVVKVEEWGKRRLAYAIDYKTEGYYVYVAFNGASELPKELSRNLGISESVIRSQIVKLLEKKSSVKPRAARVAPVSEETETAASEQA